MVYKPKDLRQQIEKVCTDPHIKQIDFRTRVGTRRGNLVIDICVNRTSIVSGRERFGKKTNDS